MRVRERGREREVEGEREGGKERKREREIKRCRQKTEYVGEHGHFCQDEREIGERVMVLF